MKIKELLQMIEENQKDYSDFMEWDVALEHVENPCKEDIVTAVENDGTEWKFIKTHCMECCTRFIKKKVFGIQVNY